MSQAIPLLQQNCSQFGQEALQSRQYNLKRNSHSKIDVYLYIRVCTYMYLFFPHNSYQALNPLNPSIKNTGITYSPSCSCIFFLLYLPQLVFPRERSHRPYMLCLEILTNAKWKITLVFSKVRFKKADILSHVPEEVVLCGMKFSKSNPNCERRGSIMTFEETNTSPYTFSRLPVCSYSHAYNAVFAHTFYKQLGRQVCKLQAGVSCT